MKKVQYIITFLCFILFIGCSKDNKEQDLKLTTVPVINNSVTTNADNNTSMADNKQTSNQDSKDDLRKFTEGKLKYNNQGIPVLMYHSIGYDKDNPAVVTPEKFKEEMKYLKDNDYTTLSLDEAYEFFEKNAPVPEKSVVLTFDDGYVDNYKTAFPVLKEYGFRAVVFVITNNIDKLPNFLTSEQLKEMSDNGFSVQSHTVNHDELDKLSYDSQLKTMSDSKIFLENLLGRPVKYIAYPYGKKNKETPKAAEKAGYIMAFTTDGRWSDKADGIYTLDRVFISGFHNMNTFKERITNPQYKIN